MNSRLQCKWNSTFPSRRKKEKNKKQKTFQVRRVNLISILKMRKPSLTYLIWFFALRKERERQKASTNECWRETHSKRRLPQFKDDRICKKTITWVPHQRGATLRVLKKNFFLFELVSFVWRTKCKNCYSLHVVSYLPN